MKAKNKITDFPFNRENPFKNQKQEDCLQIVKIIQSYQANKKDNEENYIHDAIDSDGKPIKIFHRTKYLSTTEYYNIYKQKVREQHKLSKSEVELLFYIASIIKSDTNHFFLIIEDAKEAMNYSGTAIYMALKGLLQKGIMVRGITNKDYYINPKYIFNKTEFSTNEIYEREQHT